MAKSFPYSTWYVWISCCLPPQANAAWFHQEPQSRLRGRPFSCVALSLIRPCLGAPAGHGPSPGSSQQLCSEPVWEQTCHLPSTPLFPVPVSRLPPRARLWPFQLTLPFSDFELPLFLGLGSHIWCLILLSDCFIVARHKLLPDIFISEKTFVRSW